MIRRIDEEEFKKLVDAETIFGFQSKIMKEIIRLGYVGGRGILRLNHSGIILAAYVIWDFLDESDLRYHKSRDNRWTFNSKVIQLLSRLFYP